jgi:hypothetical protein
MPAPTIRKEFTLNISLDLEQGAIRVSHNSREKSEEALLRLFAAALLLDDLSAIYLQESSRYYSNSENLSDLETCQHFLELYAQSLLEKFESSPNDDDDI